MPKLCHVPTLYGALFLTALPVSAQFMRGKVVLLGGSAPSQRAVIERVCPPSKPIQEIVAGKNGEFVWRVANDSIAALTVTMGNRMPLRCYLRARAPGMESNLVDIGDPAVLNRPELPTFVLRPAGDEPPAPMPKFSRATSREWELATRAIAAGQWPEAETHLREVLRAAPGFALAWSGLGYALQSQQKPADARAAYARAVAADPKSLLAMVQLARLQVAGKLWTEASVTAAALIAADREHRYPEAYFQQGIARYMLKDPDAARTSLLEAIRLDTRHEMPQAEYLLGAALSAKGERNAAAEHLKRYLEFAPAAPNADYVREQIARLTRPSSPASSATLPAVEPAMPVPDELLPPETEPVVAATGEARVPGGRKALAAVAHLPRVPEPASFFPEYCRAVAVETSPLSGRHVPGYSAALEAFLDSASELAAIGERRGDLSEISLSLSPGALARTERVLALLGWRVIRGEGTLEVEPGDRPSDGPRHQVAQALGIDETAMRDTLVSGGVFHLEILTENVPLAGGAAWGALLTGFASLPGGVAQGFVRQPRLARTCAALGRLEPPAAIALARRVGLRTLVNLHADSLWLHGDGFRTADGRALVPGGPAAGEIWTKLAGASPSDAPSFFEALLKADRGRLAPFYAAVARGDAAHQAWFTQNAARTQRFYEWFRAGGMPAPAWRALVFQQLPLDATGAVHYPGNRQAWTQAASDDDALVPAERVGNLRFLRTSPAVDLEALVAVARLERERGRPLDAESAALLARHFAEWRDLFPHFTALPAMDAEQFQALAGFSAAIATAPPATQAALAAEWHSLTALLVLARGAGSLDDTAAARNFGELCRALSGPEAEAGALRWLRALAGPEPDLDEAVARGLLRLGSSARAAFDRVRELQHAPRLQSLAASPARSVLAAALSGAIYGVLLPSDGLLVNEDRRLLAKHVWLSNAANSRAPWFAAASLAAVNSGEGSHFAGGFVGFEEIARRLTSGGAPAALFHPADSTLAASAPAAPTLFRADARLVEVHATVTDARGRYLDGLAADRFSVRENGNSVSVASFEPANAPISCALLLDTSESMDAAMPPLKSAASKLIGGLRPDDVVAVYTLGDTVAERQSFTTDRAAAIRAVRRSEPGGETALYDALIRVNRDLSVRTGKKVVVVFTDGEDNASTLTAANAILRARTAGIPIYTIAQGHALNHAELLRELAGMSHATGGLSFTIASPEEIVGVFQSILQDLLHGYLLAFRPPAVEDRGWRRIEIQVRSAAVRAREGYYPD